MSGWRRCRCAGEDDGEDQARGGGDGDGDRDGKQRHARGFQLAMFPGAVVVVLVDV